MMRWEYGEVRWTGQCNSPKELWMGSVHITYFHDFSINEIIAQFRLSTSSVQHNTPYKPQPVTTHAV
jgi:hypothetical protein